jgi:hypothetical protein
MSLLAQTHTQNYDTNRLIYVCSTGKTSATKKEHQHGEDAEKKSRSAGSKRNKSTI